MKLNLLPSHVAKSAGSKTALFLIMPVIIIAFFAVSFLLVGRGNKEVSDAEDRVNDLMPKVQRVMGQSRMADTVMARVEAIDRNLKLVEAMKSHNTDYTDLYTEVVKYIPSFYRINSMSAVPAGEAGATVTLNGVLRTSQDYADLVIALYRWQLVTNVSRVGFVADDAYVPNLNESDQRGRMIKPGEANMPSDPQEELAETIQRASGGTSGFQGFSNFGTDINPKGAMPGWSTVTVTISVNSGNIRTPNPRATIEQHGSGGATGGAGGAPAGFGVGGAVGR